MDIGTQDEGNARKRRSNTDAFKQETVKMKRNVNFFSATVFIVGGALGSGIFISPKGVLKDTGSVGVCLIVWAGAGVLCLFGALSYAELGCLITKSGGEYPYIMAAFGRVLAFVFAWTNIIIIKPSSVAITCLTFAEYMVTFFDYCGAPQTPQKLIAALSIITLCIINCWDTQIVATVQVFLTAAKIIAVLVIITGGCVWLVQGEVTTMQTGFSDTTGSVSSIALAFYDALWAYEGWRVLNHFTEEIQNPSKVLPRANIIGVIAVTIANVLVNISYLTVLGKRGVLQSSAVAMTWANRVLGPAGVIMTLLVVLSSLGTANVVMFSATRTLHAAAREKQFPEVLSYVSVRRYTPIPCIIMTATISLIMLIPGDISSLIQFYSFASWMFYGLTILSLFVLRHTMRDAERPIKVFLLFPFIFLVCSIYLVIAPIIQDPAIEFLYAFIFIIGGLLFYFPFLHFQLDCQCLKPVTRFVQCWMQVVPSPYDPSKQ